MNTNNESEYVIACFVPFVYIFLARDFFRLYAVIWTIDSKSIRIENQLKNPSKLLSYCQLKQMEGA